MNKVFLYGLGDKQSDYKSLSKHFYIPKINWNTVKIEKMPKEVGVLAGFSMGACLAIDYAMKHRVKKLVLCSLPPGIESLENIKAGEIVFMAGEKEKWVIEDMARLRTKNQLIISVRDTGHKINKAYREELLKISGA